MTIHPRALVAEGAEIHPTAQIGPYAIIDAQVSIGEGTEVGAHAMLTGHTRIGKHNRIHPFASIGGPPQDLKYQGEDTRVLIGDDNQIREYVSIHRGTVTGRGVTTVGSGNLLMAYSHIAHDCLVGDQVIMANGATLGGHVSIGDHVNLGGMVAIHQFSRVGDFSYIGGMSGISKDVPPFVIATGVRDQLRITGINKIGLKRHGFSSEDIGLLSRAFVAIFRTNLVLSQALDKAAAEFSGCRLVTELVEFMRAPNRFGVVRNFDADDE
ncbi:MAG: acyl-ACP--UDP-N-acetylglucosamine O-acyltransferase [Desulfobacteraceae bacterium]|nr:acyl-ACP--UDP-N-acetylglucosamine O-acyltransferase [Desulfobacteraceae bacterium]